MPKPELHKRDHEHGGADPVRIHYESVGDGGGDGDGDGTGIFYDIHNAGGYLDIVTNGDTGGIEIINAATDGIEIRNATGGQFMIRQTGDGGLIVQNDGTTPLEIHSTAAPIIIHSHGFPIEIITFGGGLTVDGTAVP